MRPDPPSTRGPPRNVNTPPTCSTIRWLPGASERGDETLEATVDMKTVGVFEGRREREGDGVQQGQGTD
ncbi:hypothetical protein E2C01_001651 [Portunus trituberculatus]|uniref:Uncharacterized protein n=1 Tax=Portunus trituberculatus TaxID=210409 RepID=A0A5B7CHV2_PORTR|nr:hypothetical protein [Portunus trituberculatus]